MTEEFILLIENDFEASREIMAGYIDNAITGILEITSNNPSLNKILSASIVDHIGIRIDWDDSENGYAAYCSVRDTLASKGELLDETIIPMDKLGRPIAIVKLENPLVTEAGNVSCVEIPAPRRGKTEKSGCDHIEMVLPQGVSLAQFITDYESILLELKLTSKERILEARKNIEGGKLNADLVLEFNGVRIKIHEAHIEKVLEMQESMKSTLDALEQDFRSKNPGVMR